MTTGRNDPCPCGSGKKYKKCCGAPKPRTISIVKEASSLNEHIVGKLESTTSLKDRIKKA